MPDTTVFTTIHVLLLIASLIIGLIAGLLINYFRKKDASFIGHEILTRVLPENLEQFKTVNQAILEKQVLSGEKNLDSKKQLIDQTLNNMNENLNKAQELMKSLEKDRNLKFGELSNQLKTATDETKKLQETAYQLKNVLANTKVRGQWGERMADDILQLIGFIEGVNYLKQKAQGESHSKPDFTFFLPNGLKVNMDVKFPLNNYVKYLEEADGTGKAQHKKQFLKDVQDRIKEINNREYINPDENTVDYVLVFIPNEQIYGFINENDSNILENALKNRVIVCSPLTLYAILSVIRQAVDNFNLEKTTTEMKSLMGGFYKEWEKFIETFDKIGKKLDDAQKEYDSLLGARKNKLEKQLVKIDQLKTSNALEM